MKGVICMEFTFETTYDQKALTAMARGLRKTLRKKRSRRSHIFGWIVIALALLLVFSSGTFDFRSVITILVVLILLIVLLFEDSINGYFAKKRMMPGTEQAFSHFTDISFTSSTEIGKTEFHYEKIAAIAETNDFFIFLFSNNHAQVYNKRALAGGSAEAFRVFIQQKTEKTISHF